ncbi:MAG TPA: ATP-dependent sacrificial sulfur transferase LarE [Candidatus Nanoarchaeia archaeon]|nr:ATP-dependent sacrificial sulfur transferase LarE [Candidatus Nanoarchaeia archaeon]
MEEQLIQKCENLKNEIKKLDSAIVAFSGGVDSVLVLKVAYNVLGNNVIAVTADSPSLPRRELEETKKIAEEMGARHLIINSNETENREYLKNPSNRCYYCKTELYTKLKQLSIRLGIKNILNGTNLDDLRDYRPGLKAAEEHEIISPLKGAKFTKNDVRELAKHLNLRWWDKPSSPCLSSRVPYGQEITLNKLKMIEEAEDFLKNFGINELRVRHFGKTARIEVNEHDKYLVNKHLEIINKKFNEIGFNEIEVSNFKSGNLNILIQNA